MERKPREAQQVKKSYELLIFGSIGAAILGVVQFCICVVVAINYSSEPFSLAINVITDLGRDANDYAAIFNISLIALGFLLFPLFCILPIVDIRNSYSKYVVAFSGCGSCIGLMLLGSLPSDNYFIEHVLALFLWAVPTVVAIMAFFYLVSSNPNMSTWFIATCLVVVVVTLLLLMGSQKDNRLVLQRILLMYSLVWFCFLVFFAWTCGRMALEHAMLEHGSDEDLAEEYRYRLMSDNRRRP